MPWMELLTGFMRILGMESVIAMKKLDFSPLTFHELKNVSPKVVGV